MEKADSFRISKVEPRGNSSLQFLKVFLLEVIVLIKIGICFPKYDYEKMTLNELKGYLLKLKEAGVSSFDFYTTMFLNSNDKLKKLINFFVKNELQVTFHYNSKNKLNLKDDNDYEALLQMYKDDLVIIYNNLQTLNINYQIPIVFHAPEYSNEWDKHNHQEKLIKIFRELSNFSKQLNFVIVIETLSNNHPKGNHIGDDVEELELLVNNIDNDNFGICWDIGHTRLNNIENNSSLYLTPNLLKKVKFTHIHNIVEKSKSIDHLPLTNLDYQRAELECLIKNNYHGIYSLEIETKNLRENILIYIDSIKKLKILLEELEQNHEFNLNK